jgi:hypothetical protein
MERQRLTFLVITDPSKPAHTVHVSSRVVRAVIGSVAAIVLFMLVGSAAVALKLGDLAKASKLEQENALLVADVAC